MKLFNWFILGITSVVAMLYSYINAQNALTKLRLDIPLLASEVKLLEEENTRLHYEIDLFESPENLMKLALDVSFADLKHPAKQEVMVIAQGSSLEPSMPPSVVELKTPFKTPLASGMGP